LNCVFVVIESEKLIYEQYNQLFDSAKLFFGIVFLIEYICRLIAVDQIDKFKGFKGKINYIFTVPALIDAIALIPLFLIGINEGFLVRLLRAIRIFSILRFGRFSESVDFILHAIYDRRHELIFSLLITLSLMLLSATLLYVVEGDLQPEAFGSIPRSLWVSSAALLSTGYGDYTPITFLGRFAAVCTALFGIGAVALPAGILASAFTDRKNKD
jgi:voltage-gated potassium channel